MNGQSLRNPSQSSKEIAGGLQLARVGHPVVRRACFFFLNDEVEDRLGCGMRGVHGERLVGQLLGFQPIGFYQGLRVLDQRIGQNGAG